ncbi:MAG: universal stress protein [Thermococcus sp.]|nr:universal stress protein [Thermococcus sp.]
MVNINRLILRKFRNIAGSRYEEILKSYREFLLTEEEMRIPRVDSVLLAIDRYSGEVPEGVFRLLEHYSPQKVTVIYVIDRNTYRLIRDTLGEKDAEKFRERESELAEKFLKAVSSALDAFGLNWSREIVFAEKTEYVEGLMNDYDVLVIGKQYGLESTKTHHISPLVFRIVQHVTKPVVLY